MFVCRRGHMQPKRSEPLLAQLTASVRILEQRGPVKAKRKRAEWAVETEARNTGITVTIKREGKSVVLWDASKRFVTLSASTVPAEVFDRFIEAVSEHQRNRQ